MNMMKMLSVTSVSLQMEKMATKWCFVTNATFVCTRYGGVCRDGDRNFSKPLKITDGIFSSDIDLFSCTEFIIRQLDEFRNDVID